MSQWFKTPCITQILRIRPRTSTRVLNGRRFGLLFPLAHHVLFPLFFRLAQLTAVMLSWVLQRLKATCTYPRVNSASFWYAHHSRHSCPSISSLLLSLQPREKVKERHPQNFGLRPMSEDLKVFLSKKEREKRFVCQGRGKKCKGRKLNCFLHELLVCMMSCIRFILKKRNDFISCVPL